MLLAFRAAIFNKHKMFFHRPRRFYVLFAALAIVDPGLANADPAWAPARLDAIAAWFRKMEPLTADEIIDSCALRLSSPGVWSNGDASPAEVSAARAVGGLIHARWNLNILLVPRIHFEDLPGFDGVVIDAGSRVIANLSIKHLVHLNDSVLRNFARANTASQRRSVSTAFSDMVRAMAP